MNVSVTDTPSPTARYVSVGALTLLVSYETIVGFQVGPAGPWVVSENVWSQTTGKHLNLVSVRADRIEHAEFVKRLARVMKRVKFSD